MISPAFLRRLFIPSASSFVVCAKGKEELPPECEKLVKAIDLPLYSEYKEECTKNAEPVNDNSVLVTTIRCMREELGMFMEQVAVVKKELSEIYLVGKAHTESTLEYLRDPCNTYPRIGAITGGALTGYMVALRKGRIKKLMFMGAGAGAVAAAINPEEAKEYADEGLGYMKRYVTIAYHFLNGDYFAGKPLEIELRKRRQPYKPNPLQEEYLDIQNSLQDNEKCSCKEESEEDEDKKKKDKKKK